MKADKKGLVAVWDKASKAWREIPKIDAADGLKAGLLSLTEDPVEEAQPKPKKAARAKSTAKPLDEMDFVKRPDGDPPMPGDGQS